MSQAADKARGVLKSYALVAWRVMGSPRLPLLERMARSINGISVTIELPASRNFRYATFGIAGAMVISLIAWAGFAMTGGGDEGETPEVAASRTAVIDYLTEVEALEFALEAARDNGLTGNFAHIARRIRLAEYAEAVGELYRAQQGFLEAPSDTEVWAIAFAGDVIADLSTGDTVGFDNITVVVDALTGQVYRVEAFYGDFESPARAPVWLRPPATPTPEPSSGN